MTESNANITGGAGGRSTDAGIENEIARVRSAVNDEALAEKSRQVRRAKAMDAILEYRKSAPPISDDEIHRIRQESRE